MLYKNLKIELCEDFMDIGYMAENFLAKDLNSESFEVNRSHKDKSMTLLISFPILNSEFKMEILKIDKFLSAIEVPINCYFLFDSISDEIKNLDSEIEKFKILIDSDAEFASLYGTQIISENLKNSLTKSLFLISKDGAIFYIDMPDNLEEFLNLDRLQIELNKAYLTYNGVGCHG